jgi:hypothetical protein
VPNTLSEFVEMVLPSALGNLYFTLWGISKKITKKVKAFTNPTNKRLGNRLSANFPVSDLLKEWTSSGR